MTSPWTDQKIARLTELWNQGVSANLIGKELGLSKNSVVGKACRLELPSRQACQRTTKMKAPPVAAVETRQRWMVSQSQAKAEQALRRERGQALLPWAIRRPFLSVRGMRFATCQFIAGQPSVHDACKCGQPTDGGPWCVAHQARCTVKREVREAA